MTKSKQYSKNSQHTKALECMDSQENFNKHLRRANPYGRGTSSPHFYFNLLGPRKMTGYPKMAKIPQGRDDIRQAWS